MKKEENMRYKIGVMGSAKRSRDLPELLIKAAEIVGRKIAKESCILVTGACMGVPDIAAKTASKAGGLVLGYSPAKDLKGHIEPPISYPTPDENGMLIFTGYGKIGRNVLSIFECDGVLFVGGGIGTLNEFSIAYHEGKVIGILEGVGGIAEKILKEAKDFKETGAVVVKDKNPEKLVEKIIKEIKKREKLPRKEIPITFQNERGRELVGILHLPGAKKPPVVIICHGYQNTKSDRKFIRLARALRDVGILVFRFDFEGCGDSEGNSKEIMVEKEVSDLNLAYQTVLKECDVDHKRIGFVGASLGAVVASLFVEKFKVQVKTLVFLSQGFRQKELFKGWYTKEDSAEIKKKGKLIKGEKEIGIDYYSENKNKDYSSVFSKLNLPILLIHGKEDKDVPAKFSEELAKRYKNITLKILPKSNHKFDDFASQQKLIELTSKWLKKYV